MGTNQKSCSLKYTQAAINDIKNLPHRLVEEFDVTRQKLKQNIHIGKPLLNKNGKDLTGCYSIYFDKARYRIVYTKNMNTVTIEGVKAQDNIAEIVGVGKRDKEEIYNTVARRLGRIMEDKEAYEKIVEKESEEV